MSMRRMSQESCGFSPGASVSSCRLSGLVWVKNFATVTIVKFVNYVPIETNVFL